MKRTLLLALFSVSAITGFAQVNLSRGLVLYLPFSGNTQDASTNGNHALNYGAVPAADEWGTPNSAYYFDGISSYMQIPNSISLQPDSQITLCAKVIVRGFSDGPCFGNAIIDKGGSDFMSGNYALRFSSPVVGCAHKDSLSQNYVGIFSNQAASSSVSSTLPHITKDKWDCLVYTYDGNVAKMYVNGDLRHQYVSNVLIGTNLQDVFLGRKNDGLYAYRFHGSMDEVRIYNRALNKPEVDAICAERNDNVAVREIAPVQALPLLSNQIGEVLTLSLPAAQLGGKLTIVDLSGKVLINIPVLRGNSVLLDGIAAGLYIVNYQLESVKMRAKILKQ